MPEWGTALIIVAVVIVVFLLMGYIKAPPDTAYIITGLGKRRILIGKAGIRLPFIERLDKLSLRVMQVDVKTSEAVPTNEFINVTVDGVANIKISSDPELLGRAAESLLNMDQQELIALVTQVLEGNMREIVGSVGLKEMVQDRQGVAKKITENVVPDMEKLGIEVVNFNIQNFKDGAGTIENMGIDNVEQIRKNAQIAKANAQRDIAIASSQAQEQANAVKVEADIARREKEAEIAQAEIAVKEKQLDAEIRKQADAENYRIAKEAEAELIRRQKEADAKKYEATQEAAARRAQAEAIRYAMEQEAEGVKAKGLAEALAIEKKAEAQKRMGEASVIEMYLQALPEIVKNAADPLAQTDKIVMYGDGNATKLVKDVMHSANQVVDGVKEATGIDLAALIAGIGGGKLAAAAAKPAEKAQNPQAEAADEAAIADAENNK